MGRLSAGYDPPGRRAAPRVRLDSDRFPRRHRTRFPQRGGARRRDPDRHQPRGIAWMSWRLSGPASCPRMRLSWWPPTAGARRCWRSEARRGKPSATSPGAWPGNRCRSRCTKRAMAFSERSRAWFGLERDKMSFFGNWMGGQRRSARAAKERLQLVLLHDRADLSPGKLAALKDDLIAVLSRHVEIDR